MRSTYTRHYCITIWLFSLLISGLVFAKKNKGPLGPKTIAAVAMLQRMPNDLESTKLDHVRTFVANTESAMATIAKIRNRYLGPARTKMTADQKRRLRQKILFLQTGPQPILVYANDSLRFRRAIYQALAKAHRRLGNADKSQQFSAISELASPRPSGTQASDDKQIDTKTRRP